jgi:membrane protease YdiL (CAAX protease family)
MIFASVGGVVMVVDSAAGNSCATLAAADATAATQSADGWISFWPILVGGLAAAIFAGSGWWRLRRIPVRPWRFGPGTGILTFILAIILGGIAGGVVISVTDVDIETPESVALLLPVMLAGWMAQLIAASCLPWVRLFVEGRRTSIDRRMPRRGAVCPDRRRSRWSAVLVGGVGLVLFWPMTLAASAIAGILWQMLTNHAPVPIAHDLLRQLAEAGPTTAAIATVAAVIVLPAIVEETLYRGLLQESFRRARLFSSGAPWQSIVLASLVFTVMHLGAVDPHGLVGLFVLSLGFGWAYARTGRLTASITMHMAFNAGNILLAVPWI